MAQYQIGNQVYELPDNLPPQQLQQILSQLAAGQAPQGPRDGAFAYSIDRAQRMIGKGIEAGGELIGSEGIRDFGSDVVAQQDRDIAAGGYQPQYGGSLSSYIGTENFFPALGEKVTENLASGGAAIVGTGAATLAALYGLPITALGIGGATLGGSVLMETGASAEEQEERTGDYDPATAATVGVIAGILDKVGAGKVIPKQKLAQMTVGEVAEELAAKGKGKAAAQFVAQVARSARAEGLTEVGQEGLQVAGAMTQGGQYTAQELVERGGDAFMIGGTMGGGARGAIDATTAAGSGISRVFGGGDSTPADPEAAAELAQRLQAIAEGGGPLGKPEFDLNDIDRMSQTGARAVVEAAHVDIAEDIKQAVKDLKDRLQVNDNDDLASVLKKVNAQAAVRMARNKTKSVITKNNFDAVQDLAGDTYEGQRLLSLIRQSNELTAVHNAGYQGGVSRITDQFSPIGSQSSYDRGFSTLEATVRPVAAIGAGVVNPAIPAAQAAAVGIGRGIDALTGRRSRVRRYIEQNAGQPGIAAPTAPSLRVQQQDADQAEAQRQADEQAQLQRLNLRLAQRNAPPQPDSPQGRLEAATGLDRNGAARIIRMIENTELGQDPLMKRAIESYRRNVAFGGYVEQLTPLIRAIKSMQDSDPRIDALRVRDRDDQAADAQQQIDARIEQGKRDNQAFNDQLVDALDNDNNVDLQTKAVAQDALQKLRLDLGKTPVSHAQAILDDAIARARNPQIVEQYVRPYLDRVIQQQRAKEPNKVNEAQEMPLNNMFEGVNDPMRVSTRVPSAATRFEDPIEQDLQIDMDAIRSSPGKIPLLRKMLKRLNAYEGQKGFRRDNKGRPADQHFKDFVKSNLLYLYNSVSPEYRERARQWYVGANRLSQEAADNYGLSLAQVAGVMAALSPQQDWYMNYDIGIRVIDTFLNRQNDVFDTEMENAFLRMIEKQGNPKQREILADQIPAMRGKRLADLDPMQAAIFVRFWDEVNNPEGAKHRVIAPEGVVEDYVTNKDGSFSSIRMNGFGDLAKAIRMIKDGSRENISGNLGDRHKVRSFYNNILNPMSDRGDVTIDTHAVAAGLLQPLGGSAPEVSHNLGTMGDTSAITGVMGSYGILADAYREAAAEVGILPREMQSITWEAVRGLFANFKNPKNVKRVKDIWKKYDKGTISLDEARGEINAIAGGINRAAWERGSGPDGSGGDPGRRGSSTAENRSSGDAGVLSRFSPSGGRSDDARGGRRPARVLPPAATSRGVLDNPVGQAVREVLSPNRQYAPNTLISGSRPATPTEVEQQIAIVERLLSEGNPIEVGKEGGAFENGIRSLEALKRIAKAMGIAIMMGKNMADMAKMQNKSSSTAVGFYRRVGLAPTRIGSITPDYNKIGLLQPGAMMPNQRENTLGNATFIMAHELGHAHCRHKVIR